VQGNSCTKSNDAWLKILGATSFFAQKGSSILFPKGSGQTPNPNGSTADGWLKIYMNQLNLWSWQQKK
jgi:hypothetical protein